jgi:hypothetical protein
LKHLDHLDQFFTVLAANGLTINHSKCTFMVPELEVFIEYPPPQDAKQLQLYLSMLNFYSTAVSHQVLQQSWSRSPPPSK